MNGIIHSLVVNLLWLWYNFTATATSLRQDEKQVDYAGASVQQVLLDTKATDLERVGRFCWFEPSQPSYKFFDRGLEPETRYKPCIRSGRFETKP
jgi:hypothetical protein